MQRRASIARLVALVQAHLSDDLLTPDQRRRRRRTATAGHCYVASEALWHLLERRPHVYQMQHEHNSHWFLFDVETRSVIDATADQFKTPPLYEFARRRPFLTSQPSARARELLGRLDVDALVQALEGLQDPSASMGP